MAKKLEFFYDYVSPYSYLADSQAGKVGGSNLVYRPVFLAAIMQATGNKPPGSIEAKGKYLRKDITRWASRYGVVYKRNPKFPQNTLKALRLAVVAQRDGVFDKVHSALFAAMFVHQSDLNDDKVLADIMNAAGLDESEIFARIADQSIKDELKANTDEAVRRGAFGAPTFFVGEEMFFGNDRWEFVKEALTS
ncbi:MAG: 2-hydroxychromene-2-carboxylate isomerase [Proteobacteria bacterium]|nr:2-hydroxychromene-2-carboxylate isomerase [Pseudomonadota bacterium]